MYRKLKEEILNKYNGGFSEDQKRHLHKKIKKFNTKNNTFFWVDSLQQGQSDLYTWVLIRKNGKYSEIVYEKKLRASKRRIFLERIKKLKNRVADLTASKKEVQMKLF